jgi:hypothetical protein
MRRRSALGSDRAPNYRSRQSRPSSHRKSRARTAHSLMSVVPVSAMRSPHESAAPHLTLTGWSRSSVLSKFVLSTHARSGKWRIQPSSGKRGRTPSHAPFLRFLWGAIRRWPRRCCGQSVRKCQNGSVTLHFHQSKGGSECISANRIWMGLPLYVHESLSACWRSNLVCIELKPLSMHVGV